MSPHLVPSHPKKNGCRLPAHICGPANQLKTSSTPVDVRRLRLEYLDRTPRALRTVRSI